MSEGIATPVRAPDTVARLEAGVAVLLAGIALVMALRGRSEPPGPKMAAAPEPEGRSTVSLASSETGTARPVPAAASLPEPAAGAAFLAGELPAMSAATEKGRDAAPLDAWTPVQAYILKVAPNPTLELEEVTTDGGLMAQASVVLPLNPIEGTVQFVEVDAPGLAGKDTWRPVSDFKVSGGHLHLTVMKHLLGDGEPFPVDMAERLKPRDLPRFVRLSVSTTP